MMNPSIQAKDDPPPHQSRTTAIATALMHAVHTLCDDLGITGEELATHLEVNPVASEAEWPRADSSIDLLLQAYFAIGGSTKNLVWIITSSGERGQFAG